MPIQKVGGGWEGGEIARSTRACIFYIWASSFILNACVVLFDSIRFDSRLKRGLRGETRAKKPNPTADRPRARQIESSMFRCPVLLNKAPPRDTNVQDFPSPPRLSVLFHLSLVRISLAFIVSWRTLKKEERRERRERFLKISGRTMGDGWKRRKA